MRAKLDENLGGRAIELLREVSHDVETVTGEGLGETSDEELARICDAEERVLITLDLDFSNVLRFPPRHAGIVVLRMPHPVELGAVHGCIEVLLEAVKTEGEPTGRLWIVEQDRIREYEPE